MDQIGGWTRREQKKGEKVAWEREKEEEGGKRRNLKAARSGHNGSRRKNREKGKEREGRKRVKINFCSLIINN